MTKRTVAAILIALGLAAGAAAASSGGTPGVSATHVYGSQPATHVYG